MHVRAAGGSGAELLTLVLLPRLVEQYLLTKLA